ncbi:MAG: inositol monophosphatase family protein [Anaerolineales bacterium]|jgi:myo-inositol-1(or 4)-monophosphatase
MTDTLTFAENLAREAGQMLTSYFNLQGTSTATKEDKTLVTDADLAADSLIRDSIQSAFPDDHVLTEETGITPPETDRPLWVIDPLDGTTNFSLGLHTWGVSIARLAGGYPKVAALYFPLFGELYSSRRGAGAFLNGQPLEINPAHAARRTAFFTCCSRTFRRYEVTVRYKTRILGSAAYDFCCVARGAAIAGFQATPKIWDIAAGWLVLEEAGGSAQLHSEGSPFPFRVKSGYQKVNYPTVMAANPDLGEKIRSQIARKNRND